MVNLAHNFIDYFEPKCFRICRALRREFLLKRKSFTANYDYGRPVTKEAFRISVFRGTNA